MLKTVAKIFSSFIETVKTAKPSPKEVENVLSDFYLQLIAADVAVETADAIVNSLRHSLLEMDVPRFGDREAVLKEVLKKSIESLIKVADVNHVLKRVDEARKQGRPAVILFVGPNGSGKTTTVVKLAHYLRKRGYSVILASADTFRAGAIEQLETLGQRAGFMVVSQSYGADPAAVAVDALNKASSMRVNVVLIDTAGRTEVDRGLLEEMRKLKRVVKPDFVIYTGDALAGNAAVQQAKMFDEVVGIDYVILSKVDADAKGGSAISISHSTGKPLLFLGVGQELDDLEDKPAEKLLEALGFA
ncbi:MAG: signal recognition particle-docking protein FtsY [Candidatus Caldarchaeum sp.]|uniref:Signal recognition particle-docking protein FtsY n=1 Tax=Caldiarchaeum subterraneum TaxID=311458 RepID=A0A7C4I226_CALS0|nr:signal recognition particle-docking protein FtsY [Candidatus Caldarchaeales archaeon]MDJ0272811.1 signal recognition particle-docking protein FtsY [Candidatus Caldarchaeales archaeon]